MGEPVDIGDPKRLHDSEEKIVPQTTIREQEPEPEAVAAVVVAPIRGERVRLRSIASYYYNRN